MNNLLDTPTRMFECDELVAEGAQPTLDIAIDETAVKTAPVARLPERDPKPMPGQTGGFRFGGFIDNPENPD